MTDYGRIVVIVITAVIISLMLISMWRDAGEKS